MRILIFSLIVLSISCESFEQKVSIIDPQEKDAIYLDFSVDESELVRFESMSYGQTLWSSNDDYRKSYRFSFDDLGTSIDFTLYLSEIESSQIDFNTTYEEFLSLLHIGKWDSYQGVDENNNRQIEIYFNKNLEKSYYNSYFNQDGLHVNDYNLINSSFELDTVFIDQENDFIIENFSLVEIIRIQGSFRQVLYPVDDSNDTLKIVGNFNSFIRPTFK